mmetsp:Transcript_33669/g.73505  ORF Transcript_33669/g.73505 Transcript_33669/m.73505 type:complete len:359 (+) Transcript_33669:2035-3111(+)
MSPAAMEMRRVRCRLQGSDCTCWMFWLRHSSTEVRFDASDIVDCLAAKRSSLQRVLASLKQNVRSRQSSRQSVAAACADFSTSALHSALKSTSSACAWRHTRVRARPVGSAAQNLSFSAAQAAASLYWKRTSSESSTSRRNTSAEHLALSLGRLSLRQARRAPPPYPTSAHIPCSSAAHRACSGASRLMSSALSTCLAVTAAAQRGLSWGLKFLRQRSTRPMPTSVELHRIWMSPMQAPSRGRSRRTSDARACQNSRASALHCELTCGFCAASRAKRCERMFLRKQRAIGALVNALPFPSSGKPICFNSPKGSFWLRLLSISPFRVLISLCRYSPIFMFLCAMPPDFCTAVVFASCKR